MLGNDFMPHFPSINIRTGGVQKLLNAYKETIGKTNAVLTDGTNIHWKQLRLFIGYLVNLEEFYLKEETRLRERRSRRVLPTDTPEDRCKHFEELPTYDRTTEQYINAYQKFWQTRYYKALFDNQTSDKFKLGVCENYMEGLEWCLKYYTQGCPDWKWSYNHSYPPLLEDLIKHVPVINKSFIPLHAMSNAPVHPYVQLCYVLPKTSLHLLPEELEKRMLTKYDHLYSTDCDFMWAYCKYFWESHVEMPEMDIALLEEEVKRIY
jgi:5'-3' exoribonuclease 1